MAFDMAEARNVLEKILSRDEYVDHGYQAARAAAILPSAIDRITELEEALCAAEARALLNSQRHDAAMGGGPDGLDPYLSWDDLTDDEKDCRIDIAREMLHCEGRL